jgi:adenosylmethionine-8-amino-7-oxononanoate aminotransferase
MRTRGDEIAAVVVEPVMQGAAGMIPQPPGWLPRVAAATKAAGALLVCDEVATGFGRTGRMFAVEHEGIEPDLMCVAKGLTGGYLPLAATLATDHVFEAFLGEPHEGRTFFHGHTYTGNPLACAAAIASIRRMQQAGGQGRGAATRLAARLADTIAPHPNVGDVRVRGLMAGIEIVKDRATKEAFDPKLRVGWRICRAAQDRGVRIRPLGDVVVLMPPLAIDGRLVDHLIDVTALAIDDVMQTL